jgi:hypothetical protein
MAQTIGNSRSHPHPRPRVYRVTASDIFAIIYGRSVPIFWRRID